MQKVPWTVGAARTQSVLHFLIAPVAALVGMSAFHRVFPGLDGNRLLLGLGFVPGLLVALVAWGLWNRRAWARRLAMVFHEVIAVAALSFIVYIVVSYLTSGGNENAVHAPIYILVAIFGGVAFGVLILASGFLWWFWRARDPEET